MKNRGIEKMERIGADIVADSSLLLEPPQIRVFDEPELLPERNDFTMSSGIARTPSGKLWVSWFGGEDGQRAFLMMASSDDDGATWSSPRYIIREPLTPHGFHRSVLGGNLWTDPLGRLWCFFTYSIGFFDGRCGVWCSVCENPDDEHLYWSVPRRIFDGFVLNKPIVLGNGDWLLPTSLWQRSFMNLDPRHSLGALPLFRELDHLRMANFLVSTDRGESWSRRGGVSAEEREFDEPVFIEKADGELCCLLRTHYGLAETFSHDGGHTWSHPSPSWLQHCSARIFTLRLASGRVLLVKHGAPYERIGRTNMSAYLSDDDGASWYGGLLLDERDNVSYPDGFQAPDGRIYIAYDRKRIDGEILLAVFTEEDIIRERPVGGATRLKIPVQQTAALAALK